MGMTFEDRSAKFLADLEVKADLAVATAAEFLTQGIQDTMPGAGASVQPGTGGDTGVKAQYTPSLPGNAPGVRTNRLKGSIASVKTGKKMQRSVGTNVGYARSLEFGSVKMESRPFMAPGLRNSKAGMLQQFKRVMKRGLK